jgi:hypothetical protein
LSSRTIQVSSSASTLAENSAKAGQLLVDRAELGLGRGVELGAGAHHADR